MIKSCVDDQNSEGISNQSGLAIDIIVPKQCSMRAHKEIWQNIEIAEPHGW